jgi:tRNA threonylcarbamoyladenosine biosynthesis protein TsaE
LTGEHHTIECMSNSVEQTMAIGAAVARAARNTDLIGLVGELGAGKTQFVRGMARGLGIAPRRVTSPTFVFLQEYQADEDDDTSLVLAHIDAYRLSGPDDLPSIGWEGVGEELRHGAVLAVEWADRIEDSLGPDWLKVTLEHTDDGRAVTFSPYGNWRDRMQALRRSLDSLTTSEQIG